jgi:diadenosine tetraphosphatase ApaH/serine/threonine PP2A family protein phosphatase
VRDLPPDGDDVPERVSPYRRIAVFGGVYSNAHALRATLDDARGRDVDAVFCLGDVGGFGPHPDRVYPLLREAGVRVLRGNYDESLASGRTDCACGYTDPRDNHFASLSYRYTLTKTSEAFRAYQRDLPAVMHEQWAGQTIRMAHGSPRQVNEFLWESTSSDAFLARLLEEAGAQAGMRADLLLVTHTGIPWQRRLPDGRRVINVGAIGRPANDGSTTVWYALVTVDPAAPEPISLEMRRVAYDHERLADEMRREELPQEFIETILTGWWTTCLEILPPKERLRGKF